MTGRFKIIGHEFLNLRQTSMKDTTKRDIAILEEAFAVKKCYNNKNKNRTITERTSKILCNPIYREDKRVSVKECSECLKHIDSSLPLINIFQFFGFDLFVHLCVSLETKIAHLHKLHFVIDVFSPERLVLVHCNV